MDACYQTLLRIDCVANAAAYRVCEFNQFSFTILWVEKQVNCLLFNSYLHLYSSMHSSPFLIKRWIFKCETQHCELQFFSGGSPSVFIACIWKQFYTISSTHRTAKWFCLIEVVMVSIWGEKCNFLPFHVKRPLTAMLRSTKPVVSLLFSISFFLEALLICRQRFRSYLTKYLWWLFHFT